MCDEFLIEVGVRYSNGTYSASGNGEKAFCTYSPEVALKRLAKKIFGNFQRVIITPNKAVSLSDIAQWTIRPDTNQACRICGCIWTKGCLSGCYWVAEDLCSQCGGHES